ncbi:DnaJ domain-containing protein [Desulfococcus sp.]|uniref:DnaJ domain-containing protein n=1 Tax=Desulfococcus sp. TaxID=2025834 RepID=UPI0035933D15
MTQEDYYQVLGVGPDAAAREIKEGYRKLAFQYHPDRNKDNPDSSERMKRINEAYAVLSDPSKKGAYDDLRRRFGSGAHQHFRQNYSDQDIFKGSDINQIFEEMARSFGLRGVDAIFKDFYGQGYQTFQFKGSGIRGGGFFFFGGPGGPRAGRVPHSRTMGVIDQIARQLLEKKMRPGTGGARGPDAEETILLSPETARDGGPFAYHIKAQNKKLVVKIPPGTREGQRIRLAGMGRPSFAGSPPGDLYLKVKIRKPLLDKVKGFLARLTS